MIQRSSLTTAWPVPTGQPNRGARSMRQQTQLVLLMVAGVVFILCIYLYQASRITSTEFRVIDLQTKYASQQRMNANLLADLAKEQSLARMNERAIKAGFAPAGDDMLYVAIVVPPEQAHDSAQVQTTASITPLIQAAGASRADATQSEP